MSARLRAATAADLETLVTLCAEHAAYERGSFDAAGLRERLAHLALGNEPRLRVSLAEQEGEVLGYASWTRQASTWRGDEYAYLDCLFLRDQARGQGLGARLLRRVAEQARAEGLARLEWQTPRWNERAISFYEREGASWTDKARFDAIAQELAGG